MRLKLIFTVLLGSLVINSAHASGHIPQVVMQTVTKYFPGFAPEQLTPSPIPGLFTLEYGASIYYMFADGRYLFRGDIIDLVEGVNLTETKQKMARASAIESLGEDSMIVFSPQGEVKATVTVFTDITCPYCAKLHREVAQLNKNGIKIRYLAYPRVGVPSSVATDMASVWCADDPREALTDAKSGFGVEPKSCQNPVKQHYDMGRRVGVTGTPAIFLEDGSMLAGYVSPSRLTAAAQQAHRLANR